ncbi:MAG: hypothetical protein GWO20_03015, partial [Candidatus Korarchaeota archaeon]|nr:hypothetical protein [Candidatus Korarchaeota archaeon]
MYHVLPENGEKIGVCSDRDIFTSFPKTLGFAYVGEVNDIIWQILETAGVSTRVDDSWDTFNDANELVENYFYKNENKLEKIQDEIKIQGIKAPFEGDIIEWMYKIYDPKKNGFQIKKSGELLPTDREVWMSGNCLFINADNFPYFYDDHEELTVG